MHNINLIKYIGIYMVGLSNYRNIMIPLHFHDSRQFEHVNTTFTERMQD